MLLYLLMVDRDDGNHYTIYGIHMHNSVTHPIVRQMLGYTTLSKKLMSLTIWSDTLLFLLLVSMNILTK
jgi:hypothetical protein